MTPPLRFRDDPHGPRGLREAIEEEERAPVPYDAARGLAALMATTAMASAAPAGAFARALGSLTWKTKLFLSVAALGGFAGVVALTAPPRAATAFGRASAPSSAAAQPQPQEPSRPEPEPEPEPSAIRVEDLPKAAEMPTGAIQHAPPAVTSAASTMATAPAPSAASSASASPSNVSMRDEIANLALIRAAMKQDPGRALALAQDGERRFAGGLFAEEREASTVLALVRLGRENESRERARVFLARYPRSPFREQVEREAGVGEMGP